MKYGNFEQTNKTCIDLIQNTRIDTKYLYKDHSFNDEILNSIAADAVVLDIGKSLRKHHDLLKAKSIDTLDINDFGDYPNIIADLCDPAIPQALRGKYDAVVCLAVLEHVYNPFKAIENIRILLNDQGVLYGYVPYLYRYHGPLDLHFQDYFRFSKDALAYLLKDFSDVTLYPVRGLISSSLLMLGGGWWKRHIERFKLHHRLDRLLSDSNNIRQCSGFHFIAKK